MKTINIFSIITIISLLISACSGGGTSESTNQGKVITTHGQAGVVVGAGFEIGFIIFFLSLGMDHYAI